MNSALRYFYREYLRRFWHDLRIFLQGRNQPKVNFLICGVQKGGTTALDAYLRLHPDICMAVHKEVHFFDHEEYFQYKRPNYSQYHQFFKPKPGQVILGETTPAYMYWYDAPRRIWEYNPLMKLIVLLRNPIERAYSHWNMQRDRGNDPLPFLEAIREEENRRRASLPYQNRRFSYLDRGFYSEQIKRLRNYFPEEQVLFLRNKDLRENPQKSLNTVCSFIGVSPMDINQKIDLHSRDYRAQMDPEAHHQLVNLYRLEIKQIEHLTGWDCQGWLEPKT